MKSKPNPDRQRRRLTTWKLEWKNRPIEEPEIPYQKPQPLNHSPLFEADLSQWGTQTTLEKP